MIKDIFDNINHVPVVFMGFTEPEEKMIRDSIGDSISVGMFPCDAWIAIAKAFKRDGLHIALFTVSQGVQFIRT